MIKHFHRRLPEQRDAGIALVVAISLIGLVSVLMLTMVAYALRETGASGRDRQRSSAISAAEGQLDLTLARIQSATPANLPCGPESAVSQQSAADSISVVTTVTYYDSSEAVITTCPVPATTSAVSAKIVSAATSGQLAGQAPARRTIETLVRLTAKYDSALDKAIFGESAVNAGNSAKVQGSGGDVYTNGGFNCPNSGEYPGSIYAQGRINLVNSCTVAGDVHAGGTDGAEKALTAGNSAKVGGRALAANGSVLLDGGVTVSQQVRAKVAILPSPRPSWCAAKCFAPVSVDQVPFQSFPILNWDASPGPPSVPPAAPAWAAAGYTNVVTQNTCGTGSLSVSRWLRTNAPLLTQKTVLLTNCQLRYENSNDIEMAADIAVFARGGISFNNSTKFKSTSSSTRRLHLIHPYDATPCSSAGITLGNSTQIESPVELLLYSPCNIDLSNSNEMYGQIYSGGTVTTANSSLLHYRAVPTYGVVSTSGPTRSYTLDTVYKRETR